MNNCRFFKIIISICFILAFTLSANAVTGYEDYIIIYHSSLNCQAMVDLIVLQESRGFTVASHEVNDGVSRDSIKNIISNKFFNSAILPSYVLLVGACRRSADSAHAGEDIADSLSGNLIPTFYHEDTYGHWSAYDYEYIDMYDKNSNTCIPDIHIGRIPALNTGDLANYVNKLNHYFSDTLTADWKNDIYLIADDQYVGTIEDGRVQPQAIIGDMNRINTLLGDNFDITYHRFTDYPTWGDRTNAFIDAVDYGKSLVVAMGTGANSMKMTAFLEKGDQSHQFDAYQDLTANNRLPVVIGASCNIGQADVPAGERGDDYLAYGWPEHLLFPAEKGAIALVGPTGSSSQWANAIFTSKFIRLMLDYPEWSLGMLMDAARFDDNFGVDPETMKMYTLYGDPSLVMNIEGLSSGISETDFDFSLSGWPVVQNQRMDNESQIINDTASWKSSYQFRQVKRYFKAVGYDQNASGDRPVARWKMFDDLCIPIDSLTRFFKYSYYVLEHPVGTGMIAVNGELASGFLLSDIIHNNSIEDMFGNGVAAYERTTPLNEFSVNVFDLTPFFGDTIISLFVEYDGLMASMEGRFETNILEAGFYPEWGSPPIVGSIVIPTYIDVPPCSIDVYTTAVDNDILNGDSLSYFWWASIGSFSGSGPQVVYNPCPLGQESYSPIIGVTVTDKGGHSIYKGEIIHITDTTYDPPDPPLPPPPSCPFIYVFSDGEYKKDNVILSGARDALENNRSLTDFYPLSLIPEKVDSKIKLRLAEEELETSYIYNAAVFVYDAGLLPGEKPAINQYGEIVAVSEPVLPVYAFDHYGFNMLDKILYKDEIYYECYEKGYLEFGFDIQGFFDNHDPGKLSEDAGGGVPSDPPGCGSGSPYEKISENYPYDISEFGNIGKVEILVAEELYETVAEFPPRKSGALQYYCDLTPYISDRHWIGLKYSWEEQYRVDQFTFQISRKCPLDTVLQLTRVCDHFNIELENLKRPNNLNAHRIDKDQYINLEFSVPPDFDFTNKVLVFKSRGYYKLLRNEDSSSSSDSTDILFQNYPNPFNPPTVIEFILPKTSHVKLEIYNILGRRVATLLNDKLESGYHSTHWDGIDDYGNEVASGIYYYRITADDFEKSKKMILLK